MTTQALTSNDAAIRRALARRESLQARPISSKSIPSKTLNVFTRQWAALMQAGIPLSQSFELLSQSAVGSSTTRKHFANTLQSLRADVLSGQSLHNAFQKHPKVFNGLYCNLLQAGESAGILENTLSRLADTPISPKWQSLWGPKYMSLDFLKNRPPFNLHFEQKIVKIFPDWSILG